MSLRWGILATGKIAGAFADGIRRSKSGELVAVGSRSMESARVFTNEYGGVPYGTYQEVLDDPAVDVVYIATPHHLHAENTIAAARAGKAILCEKPFTLSFDDAQKAIEEVRRAGVFFMEAFMYRCHPQMRYFRELLDSGAIGRVIQVNCEFGFNASRDWTNFRADGKLGGGGLMDVGTYCVSLCRMAVGEEPELAHYTADITERGYDASGAGILKFPSGAVAHFGTGIHAQLRNDATIYGENGRIHITDPWKASPSVATLTQGDNELKKSFDCEGTSLYAIEADAVAKYLDQKECPYMSIADTLGNMKTLNDLKLSAGLEF